MYQPKLFYQAVPYQDKLFDFYYKAYQEGHGGLQGFGLYDSNEITNDAGHKGFHTLSEVTIEVLVGGIIKIK